jgi:putative acyl-CoA dehydrogenase
MQIYLPRTTLPTHDIRNQVPPLGDDDLLEQDVGLKEAILQYQGESHLPLLQNFATTAGSQSFVEYGFQANRYPPELKAFDRYGQRIDQVDFHPAYHHLMRFGLESGCSAIAWQKEKGHLAHAAMLYMLIQTEAGVCCPISMTYASVPVLKQNPKLSSVIDGIMHQKYDERCMPMDQKNGLTIGMAMTEKAGGSDVRANLSIAQPIDQTQETYLLRGHKFFCSAPMSDGFLTLAYAQPNSSTQVQMQSHHDAHVHHYDQLTCFFVPRWHEGQRNPFYIQRLKDKMGNKANASSEIEYLDTWAIRVGEIGSGVKTIIDMVNHTRLDSALGNAGLMRQAFRQAMHHCKYRSAFGRKLIDQPLMKQVLADLSLDMEASTAFTMNVAHHFDQEPILARLIVAISKYWVCKQTPKFVYEALECFGGSGYVEECIMPRLYREAPLSSIWEGSGNVICLDILRAMSKSPESVALFMQTIAKTQNEHPLLKTGIEELKIQLSKLSKMSADEVAMQGRRIADQMALLYQASLLYQYQPSPIADAFCIARLGADRGSQYGDLSPSIDVNQLLSRYQNLS